MIIDEFLAGFVFVPSGSPMTFGIGTGRVHPDRKKTSQGTE
jgi:hypothetical protein